MNRIGGLRSAGFRAAGVLGFAVMMAAAPGLASAQTPPPAAPPQDDVLKFSSNAPAMILIQVFADKTADFEAGWAGIRAGLAKGDADQKAVGESMGKLFKVDQPPLDTPQGKGVIYVLQLDAPNTALTYNPFKLIYESLWLNGKDGAVLKREEADAIYEKLKASLQSVNPPWKLVKIGG
jgi:hypothetical protein